MLGISEALFGYGPNYHSYKRLLGDVLGLGVGGHVVGDEADDVLAKLVAMGNMPEHLGCQPKFFEFFDERKRLGSGHGAGTSHGGSSRCRFLPKEDILRKQNKHIILVYMYKVNLSQVYCYRIIVSSCLL